MGKVSEHEYCKERFVDNLLRFRVLCKVAAGSTNDGEIDETQ